MPSIRGSLIHVPHVEPGRGEKIREGFKRATAGPAGRAKRAGRHTFYNATSGRGARKPEGGRIGRPEPKVYDPDNSLHGMQADNRNSMRYLGALGGLSVGSAAGGAVGSAHGKRKYPDSKEFGKARAYRITEMGSMAEKVGNYRAMHPIWHQLPGKKTFAGSAAVGAGLGYANGVNTKKSEARIVQAKKKRAAQMAVAKNDPFNIEKLRPKPTKDERHKALWYNEDFSPKKSKYNKDERRAAGKILGKERIKGQAKGIAAGGGIGAAAGAALGAVGARKAGYRAADVKRGAALVGAIGGSFGSLGGQMRGDYTGSVKGQRKYKQALGKSASISAFGVNHG